MRISTETYLKGIQELHNLMDALKAALIAALPGVDLCQTNGHGWRGFQIRNYQDLSAGRYFCQIYLAYPSILLMEEAYPDQGYKYPWKIEIDLEASGFFDLDQPQQNLFLYNFFKTGASQALVWQHSEKRKSITPYRYLTDQSEYEKEAKLTPLNKLPKVSREYLLSVSQLNLLLPKLAETIQAQATVCGLKRPLIKSSWNGWKYRGLWMKVRTFEKVDDEPKGSFPYAWQIDYFDHPTWLRFETIKTGDIQKLDLEKEFYFTLDNNDQQKSLNDFVQPIMGKIKQDYFGA